MKKKVLFIDRDGTLVKEPSDFQIDSWEKLMFLPGVISNLSKIIKETDFLPVLVTNQDGLGTSQFPMSSFKPIHDFIINTLKNEGITFYEVCIDTTLPEAKAKTRKPNTGMLTSYLSPNFDLKNSLVIGDRITDLELAKNLNCKAILIDNENINLNEASIYRSDLELIVKNWEEIYSHLKQKGRTTTVERITEETKVFVKLNLDGQGIGNISTGIDFFDHMLYQLARHGRFDLTVYCKGDLSVDEHHTIEDTALALGTAFNKALQPKIGIERYGFCLPMDDSLAHVALDFGGRSWLEWDARFNRERIGAMPTEMFFHFFKSFADGAGANIHVKASGHNEHHKIESIFKAFAKSLQKAVSRDSNYTELPTTKGVL